jgi:hypothetical protein
MFEYQQSSFQQLSARQPPVKAIIMGNIICENQISKYIVKISLNT